MSEGVIPGRYAMALYKYVYDKGLSSKLYTIAQEVERAYTATPELRKTLINPVVSAADKISIMNTIVGKNPDKHYQNFVRFVIENKREEYLREIFLKYSQLYRKKNNISLAEVTTAVELDKKTLEKITTLISKHTTGEVETEYKIDPSIIGGFIIKIDSQQLDSSIDRELRNMRLKLVNSSKV